MNNHIMVATMLPSINLSYTVSIQFGAAIMTLIRWRAGSPSCRSLRQETRRIRRPMTRPKDPTTPGKPYLYILCQTIYGKTIVILYTFYCDTWRNRSRARSSMVSLASDEEVMSDMLMQVYTLSNGAKARQYGRLRPLMRHSHRLSYHGNRNAWT